MAKCAQHCIGKYIRGSGLEDSLLETSIFGIKVVEQFLNGTHYVRSLRGILILAIEKIKWHAFWKMNEQEQFQATIDSLHELRKTLSEKMKICVKRNIFIVPILSKNCTKSFHYFPQIVIKIQMCAVIGMVL